MYPQEQIGAIKDILVARQETIAVAESVTSGHLQVALSQAENARQFYQGGITAYNLGQKVRHLGVEPIHALDCDCVSEIVSGQMAVDVARSFTSTYGIGITGYSAPVPEKNVYWPFAYYSICKDGVIVLTKRIDTQIASALEAQLYYTEAVLQSLLRILV